MAKKSKAAKKQFASAKDKSKKATKAEEGKSGVTGTDSPKEAEGQEETPESSEHSDELVEEEDGELPEPEDDDKESEESQATKEDKKTKVSDEEQSLTSKAEKEQNARCQELLTIIGKRGKFNITTKDGVENFKSWLTANAKQSLNNDQLRSIWEACISTEQKRGLKFTLLELIREHNNNDPDEEEKEDFLNWAYEQWCDGGKHTATIVQMLNFVTNHLQPRVGNKLSLNNKLRWGRAYSS